VRHFNTRLVGMVLALPLVAAEIVRGGCRLVRAAWSRFNRVIGRRS
jgi:hypothetical protein